MTSDELYRRRAHDCARLRDLASTEMAKRRLDREYADWLRLAQGGARVNGAALRAGIVDKVFFYYAPRIMGDSDAVPLELDPTTALAAGMLLLATVLLTVSLAS